MTAAVALALASVMCISVTVLSGERAYELHPYYAAEPSQVGTPIASVATIYRDWPRVKSPSYSIQVFMWWRLDIAGRDLDLVKDMGFGWVKQRFAWRDIENIQPGSYNWHTADELVSLIEAKGLQLVALLDQQPYWSQPEDVQDPNLNGPPVDYNLFGDFCHAFSKRFRGRIAAYQVWNEPNLAREWSGAVPNAAKYVELLKLCYQGIKTGDPKAIVISAGLAPTGTEPPIAIPHERFLREMYAAGAQPYFDMLGLHAPGYLAPPWVSADEVEADLSLGGNRWMAFRHVEDMRAIMLEYDDPAKQIAILETGWTTDPIHSEYKWFAVNENQQAEYLAGAYRWASSHWRPWIGIMNTIYMADPDWTSDKEEYWWAISLPNLWEPELRPAYYALKSLEK